MEPEKILDEIRQLPPEAQKELTEFIGFLKMRHRKESMKKRITEIDFSKEPFVGIWEDRDDMRDSRLWLRKIRKSEWRDPSD